MEAYAGIDWDRKKAIAAFQDDQGRTHTLKTPIPPTLKGVTAFLKTLQQANPDTTLCRVAIEAGSERWLHLFHQAGAIVHTIDGKQSKRFSESLCSSGAKDDARDARVLLQMVQSVPHRREAWLPPSEDQAVLLQLTGVHEDLTTHIGRLSNRLRAHLAEYLPALDAVLKHFSPKWVTKLLKAVPTGSHARSLSRSDFEQLVQGTGMHQSTRERVWEALGHSDVLVEGLVAETLAWSVGLLVDQLVALQDQLEAVNARLEAHLSKDARATHLQSVNGVGLQLSAALLALCFVETSSLQRDGASIRLGSSPVSRHSGQQKKAYVKQRRAASSRGRQVSYLLGLQASRHLSWARAMYADGRKRKQTAGTAFRRISRSLLRILTAMLRDGVEYDEARYIRILKEKGVPWSQDIEIPQPTG